MPVFLPWAFLTTRLAESRSLLHISESSWVTVTPVAFRRSRMPAVMAVVFRTRDTVQGKELWS